MSKTKERNLYRIEWGISGCYVIASSIPEALEIWKAHKDLIGEPSSVQCVGYSTSKNGLIFE